MKYCSGCGAPVDETKKFCGSCGQPIGKAPDAVVQDQPAPAAPAATEVAAPAAPPPVPLPPSPPLQSTVPVQATPASSFGIPVQSVSGNGQTPPPEIPVQSVAPAQTVIPAQPVAPVQSIAQPPAPSPAAQWPTQGAAPAPALVQQPTAPARPMPPPRPAGGKGMGAGKIIGLACGALGLVAAIVLAVNLIAVGQLRAKRAAATPEPTPAVTALAALPTPSPTPVPTSNVNMREETLQDNSMTAMMTAYFGSVVPYQASYTADDVIFPAMYRSRSHLLTLTATSPTASEALLTVEVLGFTHKYEKKITITPLGVNIQVLPAMLDGVLEKCNTSKKGQLQVTLTDMATGKSLLHDTKEITIQSMYDLRFVDVENKYFLHSHICAWVTPEDPIIRTWQRDATDMLGIYTEGKLQQFIGYQGNENMTLMQLIALYDTLANVYKVRYNMTAVSTSGNNAQQRMALPRNVIEDRSGLCVETAAAMASAGEALGFNAYLVILPGHVMTLVELMDESTTYALIETTALTFTDLDEVFTVGSDDEILQVLQQKGAYNLISVNNERRNGIHPMQ